jgi:hypothetical protein
MVYINASQFRAPYRRSRRRHILLAAAFVMDLLDMFDGDVEIELRGRLMGTKNIKRTRKAVESMMSELGSYVQHAYKSGKEEFMKLHELLSPHLEEQFGNGKRLRGATVNGEVPSVLRLSAAIRYFCGGSIYDIMLSHGLGKQTVRRSIYGVINAVNACPELSFNANGAAFPSHEEQFEIAEGFKEKSAVDFDKIMLALDGMLVWTKQPTAAECEELNIGERLFHCYRKDKFGMLLMAGCDHKCRFRFADIRHPGNDTLPCVDLGFFQNCILVNWNHILQSAISYCYLSIH